MNIDRVNVAKQKMQEIIDRVVVDESCKIKLIHMLYLREKIFPLKGVLHEMESCKKLEFSEYEKKILNDLTAIYT